MKSILTLYFTNALLNGRFSFRGMWALPLMFVAVLFPFYVLDAAFPTPQPKVGMTVEEFDALCPTDDRPSDNDFSSAPGRIFRQRSYSKDRRKHKCYGSWIFQDGVLTNE